MIEPTTNYVTALEKIINDVVTPAAAEVDEQASFPRAALNALGEAGLLGLISSPEVGGLGQGHRAAAQVVERLATACASTAMVVCMHYAATAVIEAHGTTATREAIAQGKHVPEGLPPMTIRLLSEHQTVVDDALPVPGPIVNVISGNGHSNGANEEPIPAPSTNGQEAQPEGSNGHGQTEEQPAPNGGV